MSTKMNNASAATATRRGPKHVKSHKGDAHIKALIKQEILKTEVAEKKYTVGNNIGTSVTNTTSFTNITTIPQGVLDSARVGDTIKLLNFWLKGSFVLGSSSNMCRFILFTYKATSINLAANQLTFYNGTGSASYAPYTQDYDQIFKIWADVSVMLDVYNPTKEIDIKVNFNGPSALTQYIAGSTTTCINGLFFAIISDDGAVPYPQFNCAYKLTYVDI